MRRLLELSGAESLIEQWPTNPMTKWLAGDHVCIVARQAPGRALQVTHPIAPKSVGSSV